MVNDVQSDNNKGDDNDMASAFRAYQSPKPEKEAFIDNLYTGSGDFGKGRVFLTLRGEKGKSNPALEGDAKVKVWIIPSDKKRTIQELSFGADVPMDNIPRSVELVKDIGGFSIHVEVLSGSPVLVAVNQHYV